MNHVFVTMEFNRRKFLQTVSTTGLAASIATPASAKKTEPTVTEEELRQVVLQYHSAEAVQDELSTHGSTLVTELQERGLINDNHEFLNSIFDDEFKTPDLMSSTTDGVSVYGLEYKGEPTAVIQVVRNFGDVQVLIFVKPDLQQAHLVIKNGEREIIRQVGNLGQNSSSRTASGDTLRETSYPTETNLSTSSGCLVGGCCQKWATPDTYGCAYVNFECCVDSDGCYTCIDTGTSDCYDCGNPSCYCDCPSC